MKTNYMQAEDGFSISNIIGVVVGLIVLVAVAVEYNMVPPQSVMIDEKIAEKNWKAEKLIRPEVLTKLIQGQRIGSEKIQSSQEAANSFLGIKDMLNITEKNVMNCQIKNWQDNKCYVGTVNCFLNENNKLSLCSSDQLPQMS